MTYCLEVGTEWPCGDREETNGRWETEAHQMEVRMGTGYIEDGYTVCVQIFVGRTYISWIPYLRIFAILIS